MRGYQLYYTRMTLALRWAAMRAILTFQYEVMNKVTTETVSTNHNLFEEKGEPKRYRTEVLPLTSYPNALALGQTGSHCGAGGGGSGGGDEGEGKGKWGGEMLERQGRRGPGLHCESVSWRLPQGWGM